MPLPSDTFIAGWYIFLFAFTYIKLTIVDPYYDKLEHEYNTGDYGLYQGINEDFQNNQIRL